MRRTIAIVTLAACTSTTAFAQSSSAFANDPFAQQQAQQQAQYNAQEQANIQQHLAPLQKELADNNRKRAENQPYGLPTNRELGSRNQP